MNSRRMPRASSPTRLSRPVWESSAEPARLRPLAADLRVDACVIGAGFAGLSTAYFMALDGLRVAVLDSGPVAGGESAATTAHFAWALDDRLFELERLHGADGTRLAVESHQWAIGEIGAICERERIDCSFERLDGWLFLGEGDKVELLERERDCARRLGLEGVELLGRAPLRGFDTGPALRFPRQGQAHPLRYLHGLAAAVERLGGTIFTGTEAVSVEDGSPARVVTRGGAVVTAAAVVVATNSPFNDRVTLQTRLYPYRSYAIAARVPRGDVPRALYWDTLDSYHYVRLTEEAADGGVQLIVGGEDHKTGHDAGGEPARFARLEQWARRRFPTLGEVSGAWSGQVLETPDGLALIGRNPGQKNVFVITGDSGMGTTHGTLGGRLVADVAQGRESRWESLYSPARPKLRGASEWVKENADAFSKYTAYLSPGEVSSADEIAAGEGAVMRSGLGKRAVYRGEDGTLSELSAVCPHLGGLVCWNAAEKSWDCPLHGSRFSPTGEVLNGPANTGLRPLGPPPQQPPRPPNQPQA